MLKKFKLKLPYFFNLYKVKLSPFFIDYNFYAAYKKKNVNAVISIFSFMETL